MTYKETLFFVGQCLTINHDKKNKAFITSQIETNQVDWEAVVKVSTAHYVFPALYLNLQWAGFLHYLPEDLVAYMLHITDLNRERNAEIIAQAHEINELLLAHGITPIFLKGTGNLLEGLYRDPGERMVGDIDFIVEKEYFLKAVSVLEFEGYVSKDNLNKDMHWHYPGLVHPNKIASVEIHQKILKNNYQKLLGIDLFKHLVILEKDIKVLSLDNQILAAVLPKIINDNLYDRKSISLRNAYDVWLLYLQVSTDKNRTLSKKINLKFETYLSCMKILLGDTNVLPSPHLKLTHSYTKGFIKLLEQNRFEKKKVQMSRYLTKTKNKLDILKYAFSDKIYRKYVLKRIVQIDFYKNLMKIN